jgi:deoxyribose-phosphate aldolase
MNELEPATTAQRELAACLELNLRGPALTRVELELGCVAAREFGLLGVCVNSSRVLEAVHHLEHSPVRVICSIGLPGGAADADIKRYETELAVDHGAQGLEVAFNLGRLKDGDDRYLVRELRDVVEAADERPVSVSLEPDLLDEGELALALRLVLESGAHGVTLLASGPVETSVQLLGRAKGITAETVGLKIEVATLTLAQVAPLLRAGAVRFGVRDALSLLRELP